MATLQTVVCDLCGKPAHQQITIDVCAKHEEQAAARMNGGSPQSIDRYHTASKSDCPYCGLPFFPQGMAQHIKTKHPSKLKEWQTNRDAARDKERTSRVSRSSVPKPIPCEICGRLTSPLGMFQHVSRKHPDKFKAWRRKHPAPK